ncbi:SPOR domain-containing protein [bacterium]|nr:SPOR domain-containing protein [bacterium]
MQEHEKEFDPAKYRKPEEKEATEVKPSERADIPEETQWTERIEKTMGYRIQLYSTTSVDEAQRQITRFHDRLDSLDMQVGRLDLTFDAPYYKLRMGDFLLRPPADSVRALLHERGMTEAWVVRDRVQHKVRVKAE